MKVKRSGMGGGGAGNRASIANLRPVRKGEPSPFRGRRQTEAAKRKVSISRRAHTEAKRQAAAHVRREEVQRRLINEAERCVVLDAIERLRREGEPIAVETLKRVMQEGKDPDALAAARECFDRTRGRPMQPVTTVATVVTAPMTPQQVHDIMRALKNSPAERAVSSAEAASAALLVQSQESNKVK